MNLFRDAIESSLYIIQNRLLNVRQESWLNGDPLEYPHRRSSVLEDITAATFLDVAVIRCLFMPRWSEEGVHWALQFLFYRLQEISEEMRSRCPQRKRSSSLPVPKIEVSLCSGNTSSDNKSPVAKVETNEAQQQQHRGTTLDRTVRCKEIILGRFSEASPPQTLVVTVERSKEDSGSHHPSPSTAKRGKMSDLRAFVETRLLSRSDKMLEKMEDKRSAHLVAPSRQAKTIGLDGEDHSIPPRPLSALDNTRAHKEAWDDGPNSYLMQEPLPLVKGKSMPSLRSV